jgi:hypothetical protein
MQYEICYYFYMKKVEDGLGLGTRQKSRRVYV